MFIKRVFSTIFYGALGAVGAMAGYRLFEMATDPYERKRLEKKMNNIKDAVMN